MGKTKEETQLLLEEHNSFKEKAKETREKVKLLLQLADTLTEKGHAHALQIKSWVEEVDDTYKDFSTRMDKYRAKLEVCKYFVIRYFCKNAQKFPKMSIKVPKWH